MVARVAEPTTRHQTGFPAVPPTSVAGVPTTVHLVNWNMTQHLFTITRFLVLDFRNRCDLIARETPVFSVSELRNVS